MLWTENNNKLSREFKFLDFACSLEFVNLIGKISDEISHHPEIKISFGTVEIDVWSKEENSITSKDRLLAEKIEHQFTEFSNSIDFALNADDGKKIYLPIDKRLRNQLIVGTQGGGKSKTVTNIILKDVNQGRGVCLVDPSGQIVDDVFERLSEDQKKNSILLDFANKNNNFSLNLLDKQYTKNENLELVKNLFNDIYDDESAEDSVYQSYLNNSLRLLLESSENYNISDVVKLCTDLEFKKSLLEKSNNPDLKNYWEKITVTSGTHIDFDNTNLEIIAKIDKFIQNDFLKEYLLSNKPSFDFTSLIASNKNIFIKLPAKQIDQESLLILSFLLFERLKQAISQRDTTNSEYFVYVDNFEKFADYGVLELLESSKQSRVGFILTLNSLRKISEIMGEEVIDQILENTSIHTIFKSEFFDADIISQWYNEQIDIESLRDPIKYGGHIFFDDQTIAFESQD